jgi:hypothetical protein
VSALAAGCSTISYTRSLFCLATVSRKKLCVRSSIRSPEENTLSPVQGRPFESCGRAAWPPAMNCCVLREPFSPLIAPSIEASPLEVGEEAVSMVLMVAATSSMCPNSSAAMFATRS